jgi:hypothetical protein
MTKARKRAHAAKPAKPVRSKKGAAAEEAFRRATVARGDAVRTADGKLPPGATFELEGIDEGGTPVIKRKRFSIG